jgi:hypothetical protein
MNSNRLDIKLPRKTDKEAIRSILEDLRIVARKGKADEIVSFNLALPKSIRTVQFDESGLEEIDAERAVSILALREWIRTQPDNSIVLKVKSPESEAHKLWKDFLIAPVRIKLINLAASEKNLPETLEKIKTAAKSYANSISSGIQSRFPHTFDTKRLSSWAYEFIFEGLLNVAQHSNTAESKADVQAFLAAKISRSLDYIPNFSTADSNEESNRGMGFTIEVSIADPGVGFHRSLKKVFDDQNLLPKYVSNLNGVFGSRRFQILQNAAIAFAVTPFGSRKTLDYFATETIANTWRGLFKLFFRSTTMAGEISIKSGHGSFIGRSYIGDCQIGPDESEREPLGAPWTSINTSVELQNFRLNYALNLTSSTDWSGKTEIEPAFTFVIDRLSSPKHSSMFDVEEYVSIVEQIISDHYAGLQFKYQIGKPDLLSFIYPSPLSQCIESEDEFDDDKIALLIAQMLIRLMLPNVVLLHSWLIPPFKDQVREKSFVQKIRNYVFTLQRKPKFSQIELGLQGIFSTTNRTIYFLTNADSDENSIPRQLLVPTESKLDPDDNFHKNFPMARNWLIGEPSVSSKNTEIINSKFIKLLTSRAELTDPSAGRESWYWLAKQSDANPPNRFILTPSGALTSEFMSVGILAKTNENFHQALAATLVLHIIKHLKLNANGKEIILLPDSVSSSYLLMKRIQNSVQSRLNLNSVKSYFLSPEQYLNFQRTGIPVIVFADFRVMGTTLRDRLAWLQTQGSLSSLTPMVSTFIAIDAMQTFTGNKINVTEYRFAKYETQGQYLSYGDSKGNSGTDDATNPERKIFSINPVTGELLPLSANSKLERYQSLMWERESSNNNFFTINANFEYGLQYFAGRFFSSRWPVSSGLRDINLQVRVANQLAKKIEDMQLATSTNIILLTRTNSDIRNSLIEIGHLLSVQLKRRKIFEIFTTFIETIVIRNHQTIAESLGTAVGRADSVLTGQAKIEIEPTLNSKNCTVIVFIDNSAVTGEMLQHLFMLCSQSHSVGQLKIKGLILFPMISRLSTSEENFFENVYFKSVSNKNELSAESFVKPQFISLLQIRGPSYIFPESIPLFQILQRMLSRCSQKPEPILEQVYKNVKFIFDEIRLAPQQPFLKSAQLLIRCPLIPTKNNAENRTVPALLVHLRQLIALSTEGVPCWKKLRQALEATNELHPNLLIGMVAIEPNILEREELPSGMHQDIESSCIETIKEISSDIADLLNALWVSFLIASRIDDVINAIRANEKFEITLLTNLAFLVSYGDYIHKRTFWARKIALKYSNNNSAAFSDVLLIFRRLAGAPSSNDFQVPVDQNSALDRIKSFLVSNRYEHGGTDVAEYQRALEAIKQVANDKTRLKIQFEHIESWLRRHFFPLLASLEYFETLSSTRHIPLIPKEQIASNLLAEFGRLEKMNGQGEVDFDQPLQTYAESCKAFLTYSTRTTTDLIFSRPKKVNSLTLKQWDSKLALGDIANPDYLTWAVQKVVAEPLWLLLSQLLAANVMTNSQMIVDIDYFGVTNRLRSNFSDSMVGDPLRQFWITSIEKSQLNGDSIRAKRPYGICLLVPPERRKFFKLNELWIQEIESHANTAFPIQITFKVSLPEASSAMIEIKIENEKKNPPVSSGTGYGLSSIQHSIQSLNAGHVQTDSSDPNKYSLDLTFRCEFMEFPKNDHL